MNKKVRFVFIKYVWIYILLLVLILFTAFRSEKTVISAKNALFLCAENVIPSLFPFFVFSSVLINTGFVSIIEKWAVFFTRPLFNVGGSGAYAFIIGILSGYPTGAHTICNLHKNGFITKTEAERLLPFCNNSGPLFIIGAVGTSFLKNASLGIFLYFVHILSAVMVGFVMRFYKMNDNKTKDKPKSKSAYKEISFGRIFSQSVESSVFSVLNVCGFVVIFSVISAFFTDVLELFIKSDFLKMGFCGILEITSGIAEVAKASFSLGNKLCFISFLLGFSGICVSLQVSHSVSNENISMKTYFVGKILHGIFSVVFCNFFLKYTDITASTGANHDITAPFMHITALMSFVFLLSALFVFFKKHKLF